MNTFIYIFTEEEQDEPSILKGASFDKESLKNMFAPKTFGGKPLIWQKDIYSIEEKIDSEFSCNGKYRITGIPIIK